MRSPNTAFFIVFALLFLSSLPAAAQPPDTLWTHTYGGNDFDEGFSVRQTLDGGYIVIGSTFSLDLYDVYLAKVNASGILVWQRRMGGINDEVGKSGQQTADGGYIVAGYTTSYGAGLYDIYLVKTDSLGNQIWQRTYGGYNTEIGFYMQQTSDNGYIIIGYTDSYGAGSSDIYLIKTDTLGNPIWQRTFGGSNLDWGQGVHQTSDGGYIIVGSTESYGAGSEDVILIKTDGAGNQVWQRTYGGSNLDGGRSVQQTSDGGYIITGMTDSFGAGRQVYLVKTDASGNQLWQRTFGGSLVDWGSSVQQTSDGGYIIAGGTISYGMGQADVYLIKTDAAGNEIWHRVIGGSLDDGGNSVQQTADGGYIITGHTGSFGLGNYFDVFLIKTDADGNISPLSIRLSPPSQPIVIPAQGGSFQFNAAVVNYGMQNPFWVWNRVKYPDGTYTPPTLGPVQINPPVGVQISRLRTQTVPGTWPSGVYTYLGYANTSYAYPAIDSSSFTFTKSAVSDGGPYVWESSCTGEPFPGEVVVSPEPSAFSLLEVSPNPFNPSTVASFELRVPGYVSLRVYDIAGRLVTTLSDGYRSAGSHQVTWNAAGQPSGIYFCRLQAGEYTNIQKIVLLK
jgi:hypothetical protein